MLVVVVIVVLRFVFESESRQYGSCYGCFVCVWKCPVMKTSILDAKNNLKTVLSLMPSKPSAEAFKTS